MTDAESPFTLANPKLQRAWDATSLSALQACPRYYQQAILEGWRERGNNDLEFGGYFASAVETFKKALLDGKTKDEATLQALRFTLEATWTEQGPWSGTYETAWRCTGVTPYRNHKGNRAKCPWSHKGVWTLGDAPDVCGECESPTEQQVRWLTSYTKDRYALVRLVAAYCDAQQADGLRPISFGRGLPGVELSFRFPYEGRKTPDGEPYILCGHMDSVSRYDDEHYVTDNKTTGKALNQRYWDSFSPNTQVDLYDVAANVLWPELNVQGVIIEAAQITKTDVPRFGIMPMRRNDALREEFLQDLDYWLSQAERFASEGYWPMNRRNCWGCPFKTVCKLSPDKRERALEANFDKRHWNPLEER